MLDTPSWSPCTRSSATATSTFLHSPATYASVADQRGDDGDGWDGWDGWDDGNDGGDGGSGHGYGLAVCGGCTLLLIGLTIVNIRWLGHPAAHSVPQ